MDPLDWSDSESSQIGKAEAMEQQQLTPRSKIRALLEDVDNEPSPPAKKRELATGAVDNAGESDIELPINKRGRAGQMQADSEPHATTTAEAFVPAVSQQKNSLFFDDDESEAEIAPLGWSPRQTQTSSSQETPPPSSQPAARQALLSEDEDLPDIYNDKSKLMELVERRRQERLAEEAAQEAAEEERRKQQAVSASQVDINTHLELESDSDASHKLSQNQRKPRKASKKALEDINRETQRMERNMQLTYQARTRAKVTTSSLFAKFNFHPQGLPQVASSDDTTNPSDDSGDTPPTSPMRDIAESSEKEITATQLPEPSKKGKEVIRSAPVEERSKTAFTQRPVRLARPKMVNLDEDSDLEIVPQDNVKRSPVHVRFAKLQNSVEQKPVKGLQKLAMLAQLHLPTHHGRKIVKTISKAQLNLSLQQQARLQAQKERDERLDALRAKGIVIPTAAEKAKQAEQVEDLLAKAREEADAIGQKEGEEARRLGEIDEDSEEELEYSGSEDDDADDTEDDNNMIDDVADEESESEDSADEEMADLSDIETSLAHAQNRRRPRHAVVVGDDDEEDEETLSPPDSVVSTPVIGLPVFGAAPMGLTQIFAGTMAGTANDSQIMSTPMSAFAGRTVPASQPTEITPIQNNDTAEVASAAVATTPFSQQSQFPDPSQDIRLDIESPMLQRFAQVDNDSPVVQKAGRLMRKDLIADTDPAPDSAFDRLKKASKKLHKQKQVEEFDKKKSAARKMIDENAEESEDEWAGLGGASDDESGDEEEKAEEYAKLIDDADGNDGDAQELAAIMADADRAKDEATVQQLYRDITTGALRRKRGQAFDLSDAEDDDDIEDRRRIKRREFEKMRRALMADEAVEKIANNPKKVAFMRCLEDREDLDFGFLDDADADTQSLESQELQQQQQQQQAHVQGQARSIETAPENAVAPLKETTGNAQKRTNPRRVGFMDKPKSLLEIKKTVSSLIEDPNMLALQEAATEDGLNDNDNSIMTSPRRSHARVVDRAKQRAVLAAQHTSQAALNAFRTGARANSAATGLDSELDMAGPKLHLLRRSSTLMSNSSAASNASSRSNSTSGSGSGSNTPSVGESGNLQARSSTMQGKTAKRDGRSSAINYNAREALRKQAIEGNSDHQAKLKKKLYKLGVGIGGNASTMTSHGQRSRAAAAFGGLFAPGQGFD